MGDPRFVAIGEIGLDFFIPLLCEPAMREKQERFFREQLRIARDFGLPVLTHVRRSQDQVLKHLRQITPPAASPMPSTAATSRPPPSSSSACTSGSAAP